MNLTTEQSLFIDTILDTPHSVLLCGKAGTGKSICSRELIRRADEQEKSHAVLAPTGVAAINIGGTTIHRFLGTLRSASKLRLDFILIDECSMVRADLFDALDKALRRATGNDVPFGAVQLALVGDFAQLPPVVTRQDKMKMERYRSPYLFSSESFPQVTWEILELTHIFRQKDPYYTEILNDLREGRVEAHLPFINALKGKAIGSILCPTNALAEQINSAKLRILTGPATTFRAQISGAFQRNEYPADEVVTLKPQARAMCIKNIYESRTSSDLGGGALLVTNGDVGIIEECGDGGVVFRCSRTGEAHRFSANMAVWEKKDMIPVTKEDPETGEMIETLEERTVGSFSQIPLRLAWAVTIHKSQGMTLEEMTIDLTQDLFAAGQAYVALSRGTDLKRVRVIGELTKKDVIICPFVADFMKHKMKSKYVQHDWSVQVSDEYEFEDMGA